MFFFLSERELKKVLRDTLMRAGKDSYRQRPSNFLLVHSEHAHASYPGLFFSPARVQPLYGAGRKASSGTGLSPRKKPVSTLRVSTSLKTTPASKPGAHHFNLPYHSYHNMTFYGLSLHYEDRKFHKYRIKIHLSIG